MYHGSKQGERNHKRTLDNRVKLIKGGLFHVIFLHSWERENGDKYSHV